MDASETNTDLSKAWRTARREESLLPLLLLVAVAVLSAVGLTSPLPGDAKVTHTALLILLCFISCLGGDTVVRASAWPQYLHRAAVGKAGAGPGAGLFAG